MFNTNRISTVGLACISLASLSFLSISTGVSASVSNATPAEGMTVKRLSHRTFVEPGKNIKGIEKLNFWTGFSLFRDPWVIAPSSTKDRDGLGPLFNARSCIACHKAGSRGKMPVEGETLPTSLVIRLTPAEQKYLAMENPYGGQIQPRAIKFNHGKLAKNPQGEAWLNLSYREVPGKYTDGTPYTLYQPNYQLTQFAYGELPEGLVVSPRLAPNVFGAGLLDAIAETDLLAQEDIDDKNGDGISAKYNRVYDVSTNNKEIGRFGLKAKHPSLRQQIAAAFRDDIGITNSLYPSETCTTGQVECQQASVLGGHKSVEIPDKLLKLVVDFNRYLGVPPYRKPGDKKVATGAKVFEQLNCSGCHTPSYQIDDQYMEKSLAGLTIYPYTDLALHDMGPELADGGIEADANGQEWKTPPLWGLGLQQRYNGEVRLLHDGRARSIEQAILWHGGEAKASKAAFVNLAKDQREALLAFLNSI